MLKTPDPVLSVRDLAVTYAKHPAVDGINFDVERGKTLAIVGESGSGKSTTAMAIMRLVPNIASLSGSIMLRAGEPQDLVQATDAAMRKIRGSTVSMIFQEPMTCLNPVMTVGDQIAEAVNLHQDVSRSEALRIAVDSLRRVQLTDPARKAQQYPHQLSGGMRQRVMIAMAMACKPALLIADEPTTALDVTTQAEMLRLISELQQDVGMSVIYITHDLGVVAQVADDVLVMRNGKCVEHQPVAVLFGNPKDAYTRKLLASVPVLGASKSEGPEKFGVGDTEDVQPEDRTEIAALPDLRQKRLQVTSICKSFTVQKSFFLGRPLKQFQAVQDVSFDLHKGETLSIVGESGSGKSTLARTLLQLTKADSGSVVINDRTFGGSAPADLRSHRAEIQMVFQDPYASLNPKHNIAELIAEPLRIRGERNQSKLDKRVSELLELVNLPENFAKRKPSALSGGQRQRVCIARALSTNPSVLVLDEAVSALDVTIQAQIIDTLIDLQSRLSLSYIFISHDMGVVERISHRVAVMQKGRIVEIGSKRSVLHSPTHPYTKFLLSAVLRPDPSMRGTIEKLPQFSTGQSAMRDAGQTLKALQYDQVGPDHYILAEQDIDFRQAG